MSENLKTIRELAEELGVSKQRIQQIITNLSPSKTPNKEGNRYILNSRDVHNIKVSMGIENDNKSTIETTNRVVEYDVYLDLIDVIKEKDNQIKNLLEVQKQTQNLLDQQQRLALQDKQLLDEYKAEIKDLKALTMVPHDDGKKEMTAQNQPEPETDTVKSQTKPKKWWRFGR